jgi:ribonuclease HI
MTAASVASSSLGTAMATLTPEIRSSSARHKPYERPAKNTTVNTVTSGEPSEDGWTVVYTDGACKGNQNGGHAARAGVGVWWAPGDQRCVNNI